MLLGVNLDHVATLRQARYALDPKSHNAEPCPVEAGHASKAGGADSLTIHVRGDRRHMQDADALRIRKEIELPLNLEMGVTEEMVGLALEVKPDFVCLVPENREEVTTEGGLDVCGRMDEVKTCVGKLRDAGIKVSLFIDPDEDQVGASAYCEAEMIELHTGCFANATGKDVDAEVKRLIEAAEQGRTLGVQVNAGHGINYKNIDRILEIPHLTELNIGHSIVSRAMTVGMETAVREMKAAMEPYKLS